MKGSALEFDLILVGGGLANGLIAWRLAHSRPDLRWILLEGSHRLFGDHTWSFHRSDLESGVDPSWLDAIVSGRWPEHWVRFPGFERKLRSEYCSVRSEDFSARLIEACGDRVRMSVRARTVTPTTVELETGETLSARVVLDGRGLDPARLPDSGYQKFVGLDLELESSHGLEAPILMDALCDQKDGYRFFYVLPWSPTRVLVEDTRYSDSPDLDAIDFDAEILAYAQAKGWKLKKVSRRERGCLPIPLTPLRPSKEASLGIGMRGGLFHPTTGYSFLEAASLADRVARLSIDSFTPQALQTELIRRGKRVESSRFLYLLNRVLFRACEPEERFKLLRHFYRSSESVISRFYANRLQALDPIRIMAGRPPVSLQRLWRVV